MPPSPSESLLAAQTAVLEDMRDYLSGEDVEEAGYTLDDVEAVGGILEAFRQTWEQQLFQPVEKDFHAALSQAIDELNHLNDRCDYCLIETGQRELLAAYFNQAAQALGFGAEEDVTEPLRDW